VVDSSAGLDREPSSWERSFWEQGGGESASRYRGNGTGSAPANSGEVVPDTGGRILTNLAVTGLSSRQFRTLARDKAAIAPWTLRAFRADDGRLYLSAGRANGLRQGMELTVHEPGALVRAPNGQPINWRAGEAVGRVRVAELFGNSLAALNPVTGDRPTSEHDLILAE